MRAYQCLYAGHWIKSQPVLSRCVYYCIYKNMIIIHRFSWGWEEWGDFVCNLWTQVFKEERVVSLTCVIALYIYPKVSFISDSSARLFFCFSAVGEAQMAGCDSCSIKLWMEPQLLGKVYSCCLIQPQNLHLCYTAFAHQIKCSYEKNHYYIMNGICFKLF